MLLIYFWLVAVADHEVTISPQAYPVSGAIAFQGNQADGRDIYLNDFEHYQPLSTPWPGHNFALWDVIISDNAYSGKQMMIGSSFSTTGESWAISESFSVEQDIEYLSIKMQTRFFGGHNTWQIVPQGAGFVMARFIVNPDSSVSVFDADTQGEATQTPGQVRLSHLDGSWDQVEFKLDRQGNRYHILLNDEHIHTGTPFTTDVTNLVVAQTMRSTVVQMSLDAIEIREDLNAVPTLSPFALAAFIFSMLAAALLLRRHNTPA